MYIHNAECSKLHYQKSSLLHRKRTKLYSMNDLSERVSYVISQYDGTQVDLSKAIGITKSAVGQWKNGHIKNIRPDNLFSLAHATGFSAEWIGTGKGPMYITNDLTTEEAAFIQSYRAAPDTVKIMLQAVLKAAESQISPKANAS